MFHVNFFTCHVSKMCGSSMIPSSWSVQPSRTRLSTDGHLGDAPTAFFWDFGNWSAKRVGDWSRCLNVDVFCIVVVVHFLLIQITLKNRTLHVSFVRLMTKWRSKCRTKSEVIGENQLETMLVCCQAFLSVEFLHHQVCLHRRVCTVTTQRIFLINTDGKGSWRDVALPRNTWHMCWVPCLLCVSVLPTTWIGIAAHRLYRSLRHPRRNWLWPKKKKVCWHLVGETRQNAHPTVVRFFCVSVWECVWD